MPEYVLIHICIYEHKNAIYHQLIYKLVQFIS